jgi:glycosyltransferase involved in cell wall biosynthesis
MIIHLYCTLRNECKILPYFFRHYNQFVDRFFMYDDNSDDGSREIIEAQDKAAIFKPPLTGLDDTMFADLYSREYKWLSRGEADWVICVDADEFIYHPNILQELGIAGTIGHKIIECNGIQMLSREFPNTEGQIYEQVRLGIDDGRYSKAVVFNPSIDLVFQAGRHSVLTEEPIKESVLKLLHFRYLSEEHMRAKRAANYSRLTDENKKYGFGLHNAPDYSGEYDLFWYRNALKEAKPIF